MSNVLSLNRDLNALLDAQPEQDDYDSLVSKDGQHLCRALRLCKNDAETAHVLRSLTSRVLDASRNATAQDIWTLLDQLFSCLSLSRRIVIGQPEAATQPHPNGSCERPKTSAEPAPSESIRALQELLEIAAPKIEDAAKRMVAENDVAAEKHRRKGLKHAPLGYVEWFDHLSENGIRHDFQRELDEHLNRLVPLYFAEPLPKAPATSPESIALVRALLEGLLDALVSNVTRQNHLGERLCASGLLKADAPIPDGQEALAEALRPHLDHLRALNLLAFDALFEDQDVFASASLQQYFTAHGEQVKDFTTALKRLDEDCASFVGADDPQRQAMTELENAFSLPGLATTAALAQLAVDHAEDSRTLSVASGLPITFEPTLLVPTLRHRLISEWLDAAVYEKADLLPNSSLPLGLCFLERKAGPVARNTVVEALLCGTRGCPIPKSSSALLDAIQATGRPPTLNELAAGLSYFTDMDLGFFGSEPTFGDGSQFFDGIDEDPGHYWKLGEQFFKRVRKAPKTGDRLDASQVENLWAVDVHANWFGLLNGGSYNDLRWPAIFSIAYAFGVQNIAPSAELNTFYINAVRACLRENLTLTANHLLCYFLATCRVKAVGLPGSSLVSEQTDAQTFALANAISKHVHSLVGKVPHDGLSEALGVAAAAHRIWNELPEDALDFFGETLLSLESFVAEQLPNQQERTLEERSGNRDDLYAERLRQMTEGHSATWPERIFRRVRRIELEHDFSLGKKPILNAKKKDDYPWVVSYHKLLETILRTKLQFLYTEPYRHWLEQANPKGIRLSYEPGKVLRLLERAADRPSKYQGLLEDLMQRGICLADAKTFFRDYMNKSKTRNDQAHDYSSLQDAEAHREWILLNLHVALDVFAISSDDTIVLSDD